MFISFTYATGYCIKSRYAHIKKNRRRTKHGRPRNRFFRNALFVLRTGIAHGLRRLIMTLL